MKKKVFAVLSSITLAASICLPNVMHAQESDALEKVNTQSMEYNGEKFELVTWKDSNGTLINTIPTDIKQKEEIINYVDNYLTPKGKLGGISTQGFKNNWSANLNNINSLGKVYWNVSGYNEEAYLYPATANRMVVNSGRMTANYRGEGKADKIVLSYSVTFSGTTANFSFPPTLTLSKNTVSWNSVPVENVSMATAPTETVSATSRTFFTGGNVSASADIYKGSNIYRPKVSKPLYFPLTQNN